MPAGTIDKITQPEIILVLNELLSDAKDILRDRFFAMYLYGSLSSGDFNPEMSDIDFMIVTAGELQPETIAELGRMHMRLKENGTKWAKKLEGRYLPKDGLPRHDPNRPPRPCINEGRFYLDREGSDWIIQRHIIREGGVVLAGPPPQTLIDPVGPDDLKRSVLGILDEWWAPMLDKPDFLRDGEYQVFAVLTMCRTLYTLEHGIIASKLVSARWAQGTIAAHWKELIEKSLSWTHDAHMDILDETLDFIRFTRDHCQRFERHKL